MPEITLAPFYYNIAISYPFPPEPNICCLILLYDIPYAHQYYIINQLKFYARNVRKIKKIRSKIY